MLGRSRLDGLRIEQLLLLDNQILRQGLSFLDLLLVLDVLNLLLVVISLLAFLDDTTAILLLHHNLLILLHCHQLLLMFKQALKLLLVQLIQIFVGKNRHGVLLELLIGDYLTGHFCRCVDSLPLRSVCIVARSRPLLFALDAAVLV